jgi:hypothetical protein
MKMRLILATVLTLIGALIPITSQAADDRVFYYSKKDVTNPEGVNSYFDLTSIQVALTTDGFIQFYLLPLSGVDSEKIKPGNVYGILINADGKAGNDFVMSTADVDYYESSKSSVQVFNVQTENGVEVPNCRASSWITSAEDAIAFELLASCIKASKITGAIGIASDGITTDFAPEVDAEFKFNTSYMAAKICSAKNKDAKFTFLRTQYICNQKSGKWVWVDFAPIAAAKAKYLTEKAFYSCRLNTNALGAEISDKGKTLELDGVYKYLVSDIQFACVTSVLGMPSSVKSKLSMTRALDGIQSAKFGKISADWSYHPDDGLSITFTYN